MTTLHMDVESVRNTRSNLQSVHDEMSSQLSSLASSVQGVVGSAWQGNSANEFNSEFEQWRTSVNQILEQLSVLGQRLDSEITEWETMASKLN